MALAERASRVIPVTGQVPPQIMRSGLLLMAILATSAEAGTLAADSIVCEGTSSLEFVNRQNGMKGQPGSEIMRKAQLGVEFYQHDDKIRGMMHVPRTRPVEDDRADRAAYEAMVAGCTSIAEPQPVTVLERKSISGFAKVKMTYQGHPAEFWTYSAAVTD